MDGKRWQIIVATEVVILIAALISLFFAIRRHGNPSPKVLSNDFWVCSRNNPAGDGSLANPFDGSTRAKFDRIMNSMPPNCTIHLLVGTYQTCGIQTNAWAIKTGQKIIGSGIDNTIIHLNYIGGGNQIGNPPAGGTNIEVSDLTIDGAGTVNYAGLVIFGDHSAIRRVKAVNFSNSTNEVFPLAIMSYCPQCPSMFYSEGNMIEECEVKIAGPGHFSAISLGGGPGQPQSGTIRNNRITADPLGRFTGRFAMNVSHTHDVVVEGNYVYGVDVGLYSDSGNNRNLSVLNNAFEDVLFGMHMLNYAHTNITCSFNNIFLAPVTYPERTIGFNFEDPLSGQHRNIIMSQNTIQFYGTPGSGPSYAWRHHKWNGARFVNNRIDARLWPPGIGDVGEEQIRDNSDLDGGPWQWDREPAHNIARTHVTGTDYQVRMVDRYIGIRNGAIAGTMIHLPNPGGWSGKEFVIAREDGGGSFTLTSGAGTTINGTNSLVITKSTSSPAASVTVTSDGTNWFAR